MRSGYIDVKHKLLAGAHGEINLWTLNPYQWDESGAWSLTVWLNGIVSSTNITSKYHAFPGRELVYAIQVQRYLIAVIFNKK